MCQLPAQGTFPVTTQLIGEMVDIDQDAEFEFGLNVIILGLDASHDLPANRLTGGGYS